MVASRRGGMPEWQSGGVAEWRSGGVAEWRSGGVIFFCFQIHVLNTTGITMSGFSSDEDGDLDLDYPISQVYNFVCSSDTKTFVGFSDTRFSTFFLPLMKHICVPDNEAEMFFLINLCLRIYSIL